MELTLEEKTDIFWALVNSYTRFKRDRNLIRTHFSQNTEKQKEMLEDVDIREKKSYDLLKRFSLDLNIDIPAYYPIPV